VGYGQGKLQFGAIRSWHLLAGEAAKRLKPAAKVILSREDCMVNEVHMGVHGDEYQFYIPAQRIEEGGANFMEHA
jgi:hypothetical protein